MTKPPCPECSGTKEVTILQTAVLDVTMQAATGDVGIVPVTFAKPCPACTAPPEDEETED